MESLDVSAEVESMLSGRDFEGLAAGTALPMANVLPLDVASQFKAGRTAATPYDVVSSVAIPYLTMESIAYRFGIRDNARQTVTLRGTRSSTPSARRSSRPRPAPAPPARPSRWPTRRSPTTARRSAAPATRSGSACAPAVA